MRVAIHSTRCCWQHTDALFSKRGIPGIGLHCWRSELEHMQCFGGELTQPVQAGAGCELRTAACRHWSGNGEFTGVGKLFVSRAPVNWP